jgi:hypothetical protein
MQDVQDLFRRVVEEIAAVAPEDWPTISLELTRHGTQDGEWSVNHQLTGPEGRKELVLISDELLTATADVIRVYAEAHHEWSRMRVDVTQNAGKLRYSADVE